MDVTATTSAANTSLSGDQVAAKESLDETLNQFLMMLTTQLQNQDPLDPMDTAEFTNQLIGFSTVEQLIAANQKLDDLISAQSIASEDDETASTNPVDYIGMEVEVAGSGFEFSGSPVTLSYGLDQAAHDVALTVLDHVGQVVWQSADVPTAAGRHEFTWDGTNADGETVADGLYYIDVRAVDQAGVVTMPTTYVSGVVDGIDTAGAEPLLKIGGLFASIDDITAVRQPPPQTPQG